MDEGFPRIETETFGQETLSFGPIPACAVVNPSAYGRESFPEREQDLGENGSCISGPLRQSTDGVFPRDWRSYQEGTGEGLDADSLPTKDGALCAKWDTQPRRVKDLSILTEARGVKADLRRILCAGDTARRFETL